MRWLTFAASAAIACTLATTVYAETADELVAKNLTARGGADKLAAIHTYVAEGEMRFPGDFRLAFSETRMRVDTKTAAVRIDASLQGLTVVQAYDGHMGWRINPFEGRKDAERMGADESQALADEALIDGPLLSAHAKGSTVDYLGREDVDGTDAYKLRVTESDGTVLTYFLDPDVFLEIKMVEQRSVRGSQQETEYDFGDYEQVNGVYFPFSIASGPRDQPDQKQVITIASASANVDVNAATFAMPASPAAPSH